MAYVPCRDCLVVGPYHAARCHFCGCADPSGPVARPRARRHGVGFFTVLMLWPLLACGSGGDPAARQRYEADKQHCEQLSQDPGAQKSCMVYRGWPDGKFR